MFREVSVVEMVRCCGLAIGCRVSPGVAALAGVDRKTVRRYVDAAVAAGLDREGGVEQLNDELIGAVVAAVRPDRPQGMVRCGRRCAPIMLGSRAGLTMA